MTLDSLNKNSLKQLEKLMQLCRKQGIEAFEIGEIKFNLGSLPKVGKQLPSIDDSVFPEQNVQVPKFNGILPDEVPAQEKIKTADDMTEEQRMFYSSDALIQEEAHR